MHRIKSKSRFSDTVTLTSGANTLTLQVDLDLTHAAQQMRKAKEVLAEAQSAVLEHQTDETIGVYGMALRGVIAVVFGEEQTDSLLAFYEGRPDSMIEDILPYVLDRVAPMMARASRKRARQLARRQA
ncbi:MAG: hypothetical protein ACI4O7_08190 [Aristaeellaceae bacterium]